MNEIQERQQALVDQLKEKNCITTSPIEQAFLAVPRHLFLPGEPLDKVYTDWSVVVRRDAEGQLTSSSSQPAIMAIMLEQLDLRPGQRVLEVGAGTGFNAALIASVVGPGGAVVAVDIQPDLVEHARACLDAAGYEWVQAVVGDGGYGYPDGALYDRIILSVASSVIAPAGREVGLALGPAWRTKVGGVSALRSRTGQPFDQALWVHRTAGRFCASSAHARPDRSRPQSLSTVWRRA